MCALVCEGMRLQVRVALILTFRSLFGEKLRTNTNSYLEPRAEKKVTIEATGILQVFRAKRASPAVYLFSFSFGMSCPCQ